MHILGINSAYHESAAALLRDGELVAFVEEERLNRRKHGKPSQVDNPDLLPENAIRECLRLGGITLDEVDLFGYGFAREGRRENIGRDIHTEPGNWGTPEGEERFHAGLLRVPQNLARMGKNPVEPRFRWVAHHTAHLASAFLCSPFEHALVLAVDGIGEIDSLVMAEGNGRSVRPFFQLAYPHSLGFLWEKIAQFLGFTEYDACKVMGLSSYGHRERFRQEFGRLAHLHEDGRLTVDGDLVRFRRNDFSALEPLFGPHRPTGAPITTAHEDLAATLQAFTEDAMLALVRHGRTQTGAKHLCLSGGVALNCVANALLEREAGFDQIFVQPAANDAGTALGAALHLWVHELGRSRQFVMHHAYWGPEYSPDEIRAALQRKGCRWQELDAPARTAARMVADGQVVGWFQGRMESGPRALGNRTLLADPRRADMRDLLNHKVKHREPFRPFAPSVLAERAAEWFDLPGRSPSTGFMLLAYPARPGKREQIPAVVHVDGTSRIQTVRREDNPRYHELISAFDEITGVPLVLNTSFNDSEPIVMTPDDALATFAKTRIDAVILDRFLVTRPDLSA